MALLSGQPLAGTGGGTAMESHLGVLTALNTLRPIAVSGSGLESLAGAINPHHRADDDDDEEEESRDTGSHRRT